MDKINVGVIGLGNRGSSNIEVVMLFDYVNIVAVCDNYEDRVHEFFNKLDWALDIAAKQLNDINAPIISAILLFINKSSSFNRSLR